MECERHSERWLVSSQEVTLCEVMLSIREEQLGFVLGRESNRFTYVRLIDVSLPPISPTVVAIECGAKKLYSHDEASEISDMIVHNEE